MMRVYFSDGTKFTSLLDLVYPVGAIYCTQSSQTPANTFGGTWTQITGRFLVGMGGAGTSNTEDHFGASTGSAGWTHQTVGATGGQGWVTLIESQMPKHSHTCSSAGAHTHTANSAGAHTHATNMYKNGDTKEVSSEIARKSGLIKDGNTGFPGNVLIFGGKSYISTTTNGAHTHSTTSNGAHTHTIGQAGGDSNHNNMPPYYVVYIWRRTA